MIGLMRVFVCVCVSVCVCVWCVYWVNNYYYYSLSVVYEFVRVSLCVHYDTNTLSIWNAYVSVYLCIYYYSYYYCPLYLLRTFA